MKLFDAMHMASLLVIVAVFLGLFFAFRKRSLRAKYIVLGVIMGLNILQHVLKFWVWPHMRGRSFGIEETAYNVCAFMILLCPFSTYGKSNLLKQYQFYVGTVAGICAPFVPYWFVGKSLLTSEFLRFWSCHALLFLSSCLPGVWGMVKFRLKDGWKFGFLFLGMLGLILLNNTFFYTLLGYEGERLERAIYAQDPVWMMGPPRGENVFKDILTAITFPIFKNAESGRFTPILWYALPVYAAFLFLGYLLGWGLEALQKRQHKNSSKQVEL